MVELFLVVCNHNLVIHPTLKRFHEIPSSIIDSWIKPIYFLISDSPSPLPEDGEISPSLLAHRIKTASFRSISTRKSTQIDF